jgi:hypothetical protein
MTLIDYPVVDLSGSVTRASFRECVLLFCFFFFPCVPCTRGLHLHLRSVVFSRILGQGISIIQISSQANSTLGVDFTNCLFSDLAVQFTDTSTFSTGLIILAIENGASQLNFTVYSSQLLHIAGSRLHWAEYSLRAHFSTSVGFLGRSAYSFRCTVPAFFVFLFFLPESHLYSVE